MTTEVVVAEVVSPPPVQPAPMPQPPHFSQPQLWSHWVFLPFKMFHFVSEWMFGLACLIVGVGYIATIPLIQFVALGYLLDVSGQIALTGRLSAGFQHVRLAARIGSVVAGTWLTLLLPNLISDLTYTASIIDPNSGVTVAWNIARIVIDCMAAVHVVSAWSSGGRLRDFLWPLWLFPLGCIYLFRGLCRATIGQSMQPVAAQRSWLLAGNYRLPTPEQWFPPLRVLQQIVNGEFYQRSRDAVWNLVAVEFQPITYLWVGALASLGTFMWLGIPVSLMMAGTLVETPLGVLCGWLGALFLSIVLLYLPFLQVHFVCEQRFGAFFEVLRVRQHFRRAPIAFLIALFCTLTFAIPLYLLKIELTPREVTWLPSVPFVAFMLAAKVVTGWAMSRAYRRHTPRLFLFRWFARFAAWPITLFYVLIVFLSQYFAWYGVWQLLEQHAFLVPAPFMGR